MRLLLHSFHPLYDTIRFVENLSFGFSHGILRLFRLRRFKHNPRWRFQSPYPMWLSRYQYSRRCQIWVDKR